MLKDKIKKNMLFILIFIGLIFCFWKKDNHLPILVASYPDTWQEFNGNEEILNQTWLSSVKKISEIKVECRSEDAFENVLQLDVVEADTGSLVATTSERIELDENETETIVFKFGSITVKPGIQYIFKLRCNEKGQSNTLCLKASSNHMGCTINGKETDLGIAFEITYVKSSRLFWVVSSLFPIGSIAFLFMVLWRKKWEETIGLAMACCVGILYIAGILSKLEWGISIVYVISILCFGAGIYLYNKGQYKLKELFSWGIVVFGVIFIAMILYCSGMRFSRWDDFSHWGLAVKDMFYSNSLAKHIDTTVRLTYYPPVTTLMGYFFCYTNGFFSESMAYVGLQFLMLGLISVSFKFIKKAIHILPIVLSTLFIPIIFFEDAYCSLHADPLIAIGFAYIIICYFTEEMDIFNLSRIMGGIFLLTMTKDVGVVFAGIAGLVILGDTLYRKKGKKSVFVAVLCIIETCFIFFLWQYYLSVPIVESVLESGQNIVNEVSGGGAIGKSGITIEGIVELLKGDALAYKYQVIKNYIEVLFSDNTYIFGSLSFSYVDFMFLLLIISLFAIYFPIGKNAYREIVIYSVFTMIGGCAYAAFILVTYLFSFVDYEALMLHSHSRYLGTYACAMVMAWLIILFSKLETENVNEMKCAWALAAILLIVTPVEKFVITNMDRQLTDEQVYGFYELGEIIRSGAKKSDRIYFICNNSDGYASYQFRTEVVPMILPQMAYNIYESWDSHAKQYDLYTARGEEERGGYQILSLTEWEEELKDYQYVVIFSPNDVFPETYGELFVEPETIDDGTVYRVNTRGEDVELRYVGKTGIMDFR